MLGLYKTLPKTHLHHVWMVFCKMLNCNDENVNRSTGLVNKSWMNKSKDYICVNLDQIWLKEKHVFDELTQTNKVLTFNSITWAKQQSLMPLLWCLLRRPGWQQLFRLWCVLLITRESKHNCVHVSMSNIIYFRNAWMNPANLPTITWSSSQSD